MTYPDQYYRNVIEPAKLGKGPVPGKIEMLSKAQPFKAMRIGIDPYLPKSMQTGYDAFRAAPTKAAATALGWGAKGLGYLASLPAQAALMTLHSTPANADEVEWEKQLMKNQQFKQQQLMNKKKQQVQLQKFKNIEAAAAKEAAQKAATKKQAAQNKKNKTGGYQSSHGGNKGFMGGKGTAAEMGSFAQGGLINFYRYGGFI